jgi:hypothetical protein
MKILLWTVSLMSLFLLFGLSAPAQCGIYTYQNLFVDSNGNVLGDNFTQAQCSGSSSYAESHVNLPSGTQRWASANGAVTAEAVAHALTTASDDGSGSFFGDNDAWGTCWEDSYFSFNIPFMLVPAVTFSGSIQLPGTGTDCQFGEPCTNPAHCLQTNYCTAASSPPTCSVNNKDIISFSVVCPPGYETPFIAYKIGSGSWKCTQGGFITGVFDTISIPYYGPLPNECTKLP